MSLTIQDRFPEPISVVDSSIRRSSTMSFLKLHESTVKFFHHSWFSDSPLRPGGMWHVTPATPRPGLKQFCANHFLHLFIQACSRKFDIWILALRPCQAFGMAFTVKITFIAKVSFILAIFVTTAFGTTYTFNEPNSDAADWDNVTVWSPSKIPSDGDSIIINRGTLVIWGYNLSLADVVLNGRSSVILIDSFFAYKNISMVALSNFGLSNSTFHSQSE